MNLIFSLAAFLIPFITYLLTLAPTITYGDNSELIAAAYSLGIPHPPGYPLFCILGKLFSMVVPLGEAAYRMNLMSAVLGAAAVLFVYLTLKEILKNNYSALAAALTLAFSKVFWAYSVQAEVFALNNFLLALVLYFTVKKNWRLVLLFLGLGLANQQNIILIVPALIYFFRNQIKANLTNPKKIAEAIFWAGLGLVFYLYLPMAASANPAVNTGNPVNFKNFFEVVSRKLYQTGNTPHLLKNLLVSIPLWPVYAWFYFKELSFDFTLLVFALMLLGFWAQWKNSRSEFRFVFLAWFFLGPVMLFMNYSRLTPYYWQIIERQVLGASLLLVIWLGYGLEAVRKLGGAVFANFLKSDQKKLLRIFFPAIFLLLPVFLFAANFKKCDLSDYYYGYDLGKNILKSLPKNSVVISQTDDPFFELQYFQAVEKIRPDVVSIFRWPMSWQINLYRQNLPQLNFSEKMEPRKAPFKFPKKWLIRENFYIRTVINNFQKYPFYTTTPTDIFTDNLIPMGIVLKIADNHTLNKIRRDRPAYKNENLKIEKNYQKRGDYSAKNPKPFAKYITEAYNSAKKFQEAFLKN